MKTIQGKPMFGGKAKSRALVTRMPINFTAALATLRNVLPGGASQLQDRHHELYQQKLRGKVLVFPSCIGSTYTGMLLLGLIDTDQAPAAIVVQDADPLLVSGIALADVWLDKRIPVVQYDGEDLFEAVATGDEVSVCGDSGEITIY